MKKDLPSFKYQLEKKKPRIGPGGTTRGASVVDFPASIGIAGVSMRLMPGAMRELHWHANAAEWAFIVEGYIRTTIIHPNGVTYTDSFGPGDVWYFPKGYGHVLQGLGPGECHFILIFDNGNFSEDHTFSVTDFLSHMPKEIVSQNLGISLDEVDKLYKGEAYFAQGPVPDTHSMISDQRPEPELISPHRYPLMAQQPRRIPGGGTQRLVTSAEFPISKTITGTVFELQPGALRELHWHPNADEWQYFISGKAEMTVFLAEGEFVTEQMEKGDVGYVPMGAGHYIKNTGDDVCTILIGFNDGQYQSIDMSLWLASNPKDIVAANLGIPMELAKKFPDRKIFIEP